MHNNITETDSLKYVGELVTSCPICGYKRFTIRNYMYNVMLVGRVILSIGICKQCGYRSTDVKLAEARGPKRIVFHVKNEQDLNALIIRSSKARITIPELGLELEPGPASEGFITTIEGLLHRFRDMLDLVCRKEANETCRRKQQELHEAIEGRKRFRVMIEDPEGASAIIPNYRPH